MPLFCFLGTYFECLYGHGVLVLEGYSSRLKDLLSTSSGDMRLKSDDNLKAKVLIPMNDIQMHLPAKIGDYTDFYSSRDHATNVGIMIREGQRAAAQLVAFTCRIPWPCLVCCCFWH